MPRLDWIGRKAVENHHKEVPFRLLKCDKKLSVGDPESGNLLVEGDNLEALKALLPYYAGQVKCIYIDPPYNTGNESWTYNDNVNSPEIRKWLGKVVGKEAEDLSRHDKWLCMMYPRLKLLRQFLKEDGAIFISLDDNEIHNLRLMLDEIFGRNNFISTIVWQKIYTVKNSAKHLSEMHDYVVIYALNKDKWNRNLRPRDEGTDEDYSNPDDDPNGSWISHALQSRNKYSKGVYSIKCPGGRFIEGPPSGTYWRLSEKNFWKTHDKGQVWWGESGNNNPRIKEYLKEAKEGVVPTTWWIYQYAGTNSGAKVHLRQMIGEQTMFTTPKPVSLVRRILELASDEDSLIMDAFAGTGVTGHAVLEQNNADSGNRKFIIVEMEKDVAQKVTSNRIKKAIEGYTYKTNKGKVVNVDGLGGGVKYCKLGTALFDADGNIQEDVSYKELSQHVFFVETGKPLEVGSEHKPPLIGKANNTAVYLLYNGILKDKKPQGGNVLTRAVLAELPKHDGPKVIYGTNCLIGIDRLRKEGIIFKQIPYEIKDY